MEVCSQNLFDPQTVLLKVNGNKCNMACEYCSELPKEFSEEQCTFEYEKIKMILEKLPKDTDIILHGGEPSLIGIENVKKIASLIHTLGFRIKLTIQTNGMLSDKWIEFFKENEELIRVSVSIDGNSCCNAFRKTKNEDKDIAFETVDNFLCKIDALAIEFRCIATVNSLSWDKGNQIVEYFNKFNYLKFLRINPCFDIDCNGVKKWAITPLQYLQCLKDVFYTMITTEAYRQYRVDPLMDIAESIQRQSKEYEFKCNKFSSIFPNGLITSCDAMREIVQCVEIGEDMFAKFTQPQYVFECIDKCNNCGSLSICKGGCPPLMHRYSIYAPELLNEYCQYRVQIRQYIQNFIYSEK